MQMMFEEFSKTGYRERTARQGTGKDLREASEIVAFIQASKVHLSQKLLLQSNLCHAEVHKRRLCSNLWLVVWVGKLCL